MQGCAPGRGTRAQGSKTRNRAKNAAESLLAPWVSHRNHIAFSRNKSLTSTIMSLRVFIPLVLLLPVALIGMLAALQLTLPVPQFGRDYVVRVALAQGSGAIGLPAIAGPADEQRPLVVIDAGHGGRDPGAVAFDVREKDVTLAIAIALREALLEQGGVRVALTREEDRLLTLDERPEIARRLNADLFVSIHADSAGETAEAAGGSVYTLSNTASSAAAARFARKENSADRLNGIEIAGENPDVSAILVDLSQRQAKREALDLAALVVREGRGELTFHPQAIRGADLVVLRAPDLASILFEVGFVTNEEEAARLSSSEGQEVIAEVLARAIRIHFIRQGMRPQ